MHTVLCDHPGADIFIRVGEYEGSAAVEPGEVYAGAAVHRCRLLTHDSGVDVDGLRQDQSFVAGRSVLFGSLWRDVFESGRTQRGDEARAKETGWDHDGRLVFGVVARE